MFNSSEINQDDSFLHLKHDRIADLLESDSLIVESEEQVYKFVLAWLRYDLSSRQKYVAKLMANVRLSVMRKDYLKSHVQTEPLLKCYPNLMNYISELIQSDPSVKSARARPRLIYHIHAMVFDIDGTVQLYDLSGGRWKIAPLTEFLRYVNVL